MRSAATPLLLSLFTACTLPLESLAPDGTVEDDKDVTVLLAQDDNLADQFQADDEAGWKRTGALHSGAFNRVGLRFDAPEAVAVQVRASADGVSYGPWQDVEITYVDNGAYNAQADVPAGSTVSQVRVPTAAVLTFLAVEQFPYVAPAADAVTLRAPVQADQGLAATGITVSRAEWGALATRCTTTHSPAMVTVHHTETPNNDTMTMPARVRQIQDYHMNTRGWCDIGYHFLVGQDGKVYVGREEQLLGAHAGGANTNNTGISFVGSYMTTAPTAAVMAAGAKILNALSHSYSIALSRSTVKGHREVGTTVTDCPGDALFNQLSSLIARALALDSFCASHNGTWCDGASVVTCTSGAETSRTACTYGCQSMPAGTADACAIYTDLLPTDAAYSAAIKLRNKGALWGCAGGRFCPNDPVTRDVLASVVAKLDTTVYTVPRVALFTDVPSSHWAYAAVQEVGTRAVMSGCATGRFCPGATVDRATAAMTFRRSRGYATYNPTLPTFSDVPRTHAAFGSIERSYRQGWSSPCSTSPLKYCPATPLTRAQLAVMAVKVYGL